MKNENIVKINISIHSQPHVYASRQKISKPSQNYAELLVG